MTKHIKIDSHVVRDKVQARIVHLLPISSKKQVPDILTKSLYLGPFNLLQNKVETIIHYSLRGDVNSENEKAEYLACSTRNVLKI